MKASDMELSDEHEFETDCGRIVLRKPKFPDLYWRLEWYEDGVRRQTTGGRTAETALARATKEIHRLDANAAPRSRARVGEVLEEYLLFCKHEHSLNHNDKLPADLRKALAGLERVRCEDLTRARIRAGCATAPTESSFTHRRSRLSTFLKWAYEQDYFSEVQRDAVKALRWTPPKGYVPRPQRGFSPAPAGESERFVTPDQVPTHEAIVRLGDAFDEILPYGKLMIEFTYNSGLRSGELYAVDAPSLYMADRELAVNWQILSLAKLSTRKQRPKNGTTRVTNFPDVTITGYDLAAALEQRLDDVAREHAAGRNPHRLLFPSPKGGWWWATSFTNKYFSRAAEAAGWERLEWTEANKDGKEVRRRMWVHTMHSLRHRFARDRIDIYDHGVAELQAVGGWQSAQVLWERYYGQSKDLLERSGAKLRARAA